MEGSEEERSRIHAVMEAFGRGLAMSLLATVVLGGRQRALRLAGEAQQSAGSIVVLPKTADLGLRHGEATARSELGRRMLTTAKPIARGWVLDGGAKACCAGCGSDRRLSARG